ncbi:MAG: hypothetical protein Q9185_002908 [Variospora sp. 1 TL-2023]
MAVWNTTAYLFVIIAGSILGFLLLIGIIGIIIEYMRERKLERDLEANQAQPESNPLPQVEMVAVEPKPSNGPDEIRRNTIADPTFVDVDLSDAIGQNLISEQFRGPGAQRRGRVRRTRLMKSACNYFRFHDTSSGFSALLGPHNNNVTIGALPVNRDEMNPYCNFIKSVNPKKIGQPSNGSKSNRVPDIVA